MRAANANKNELKPWLNERWVLPKAGDADFVAAMENVLEVYQWPLDERRPLVCLDKASKQLVADVTPPQPMEPGRPARQDYECERKGTANLFMLCAPLAGWRHVEVTERRTAVDFAQVLRDFSGVHFLDAERIVLVTDNLNTHKLSALDRAFPPDEARRIYERFEVHHTPKHASWLNIAECELSAQSRQCLDQRIDEKDLFPRHTTAWETARNAAEVRIDWQSTDDDARIRLKKLYPVLAPNGSTRLVH